MLRGSPPVPGLDGQHVDEPLQAVDREARHARRPVHRHRDVAGTVPVGSLEVQRHDRALPRAAHGHDAVEHGRTVGDGDLEAMVLGHERSPFESRSTRRGRTHHRRPNGTVGLREMTRRLRW
jgi:hypothetical protein